MQLCATIRISLMTSLQMLGPTWQVPDFTLRVWHFLSNWGGGGGGGASGKQDLIKESFTWMHVLLSGFPQSMVLCWFVLRRVMITQLAKYNKYL